MEESGHGISASTAVGDQNNIKNEEVDNNANNKDDKQKQASQQQQQLLLSKGNDAYYEYYRRQNICNNNKEEETSLWNEAYQKLRTSLPITYRIHESNPLSAFSVKLLSLIDTNDADDDDERQLLEEWSFNDDAESNDKDKDNIPTLRMRIASNVHRSSNKSKKRSNNNITTNKEEEDNDYSSLLHALQELGAIHRQELVR